MALKQTEDKKQKWEQVCEAAGIDFSLTNPGIAYSFKDGEQETLRIRFPSGPVNLIFLPSFQENQEGVFSWSFGLSNNHAVTFAAGMESNLRKRTAYLMESAPYGFRSSGIAGANPKYVRFQGDWSEEPRWYTITINFDTKEFLLESDKEKRLYKVDLIDLHKHWPLCVGICGHHNTTIEMKVNQFCSVKPAKRG